MLFLFLRREIFPAATTHRWMSLRLLEKHAADFTALSVYHHIRHFAHFNTPYLPAQGSDVWANFSSTPVLKIFALSIPQAPFCKLISLFTFQQPLAYTTVLYQSCKLLQHRLQNYLQMFIPCPASKRPSSTSGPPHFSHDPYLKLSPYLALQSRQLFILLLLEDNHPG